MAREILPDDLWMLIGPLLPPEKPQGSNGRPPVSNRRALTGILFVLRTGMAWEDLPKEMGCGCGMTCWRRLETWQQSGVWAQIHEALLAQLHKADAIDWSRAVVDSSSIRAVFGGKKRALTQRIGAKRGLSIMCSATPMAFPCRSA